MTQTCRFRFTPQGLYALALDGAHYLSLADDPAFDMGTVDFALDALLYVDSTMADGEGWICAKGASSLNSVSGWHFFVNKTDLKLGLRLNDGDVSPTLVQSSAAAFALDTWFWARVEADRSGYATFYVNGVAVGTGLITAAAGSLDNAEPFKVGAYDASTLRWKGKVGMVRVDKGRLLPASWHTNEWSRLCYGSPRGNTDFAQDFTAVWTFGETLVDLSSNGYALVYQGGSTPSYVAGYPSLCDLEFDFHSLVAIGDRQGSLDNKGRQRAADNSLRTSLAPPKRTWEISLERVTAAQKTFFRAIEDQGVPFQYWEDITKPRTCQAFFADPLEFETIYPGAWQCDLTFEEI